MSDFHDHAEEICAAMRDSAKGMREATDATLAEAAPVAECGTCFCWGGANEAGFGKCRRFPPTVIWDRDADSADSVNPWTEFDDWCAEHRPKA